MKIFSKAKFMRTGSFIAALGILVSMCISSHSVEAITKNAIQEINLTGGWFSNEESGITCPGTGAPTNLNGNDNIEKAFNYFVSKGLTDDQAAGVLGNMLWESGVIPEKIQGGRLSKNPSDAGGLGWGIIQWTPGGKIIGIAEEAGVLGPIYELATQLDIVWWHMNNTSPTGAQNMAEHYKTVADYSSATREFEDKMEGANPLYVAIDKRIALAKTALDTYGGNDPGGISSSAPLGDGSCPTMDGGEFIDGFKIYSQTDPAWKDAPYDPGTIGPSGCGPTSMAMIVTNLLGRAILPPEVATYAASQGMHVEKGSDHRIAPVVAEHYGLKSVLVGADQAKITAALRAGALIAAPGDGAIPFTSGGHYIVIRAVTASGKWLVGDPYHADANTKEWEPSQIVQQLHGGGVYAISK